MCNIKKEIPWDSNHQECKLDFRTCQSVNLKLKKKILVTNVSGPSEVKIGEKAEYLIVGYSINDTIYCSNDVSDNDKKKVKWKIEVYGKCDVKKPTINIDDCSKVNGFFEIQPDKLIIKKIPNSWTCCIGIYPYIESPVVNVRQISHIDVYTTLFSGRKAWGKLQTGFAREYRRVSQKKLDVNLDSVGKSKVTIMKFMNENVIKSFYENGPLGVRAVLSDTDNIENRLINNFYKGKGRKLSFNHNSEQSKKLKELSSFQEYWKKYLCVILSLARDGKINRHIDIEEIFKEKYPKNHGLGRPNFSNISEMYSSDYYGLMGGTQRIEVDIEITHYTRKACKEVDCYEIETHMFIQDWYGADWGDINGLESKLKGNVYSLNAFFWLQHYYGYQPFETEIIYWSKDKVERKDICS